MDIFVSWSGPRSEAVARALCEWIPLVLQSVKPWMSREIEKGLRWDDVIADRLETANFGIVCLTPENLTAEWVLFEAGALSKKARDARVCTYLYAMTEADVSGPLAKFQHTRAEKDDTKRLLEMLNRHLAAQALDADRFAQTFDHWWPNLQDRLKLIVNIDPEGKPRNRDPLDKLDEILLEVRSLRRSGEATSLLTPTLSSETLEDERDEDIRNRKKWLDFVASIGRALRRHDQVQEVHRSAGNSDAVDIREFFDLLTLISGKRVGIDIHLAEQVYGVQPLGEFAARHALQFAAAVRAEVCDLYFMVFDRDVSKSFIIHDFIALADNMKFKTRVNIIHGHARNIAAQIVDAASGESSKHGLTTLTS